MFHSPDQLLESCKFKYLNFNSIIWLKLEGQNAFYCREPLITVVCRQNSSKMTLSGVGKIEIPNYRVLYIDHIVLTPTRSVISRVCKDFSPENPHVYFTPLIKETLERRDPQSINKGKQFNKDFSKLAKYAKDLNE